MDKKIMIAGLIIIIAAIIVMGYKMTGNAIKENPKVKLTTSEGVIVVELYPESAPITVENFLSYVNEGAYEGTIFHRVIADFMIQGGGFTADGKQKPTNNPIKLESNNGLKNEKYTIAMARTNAPNSATNQFFINTADNDFLNYGSLDPYGKKAEGYAVFGKVIEGQDVVDKIGVTQTTVKNGMQDWPVKDIMIEKAEVI
jgi:cyclophilin family peptidyl-prolyl cis-trans isomerase